MTIDTLVVEFKPYPSDNMVRAFVFYISREKNAPAEIEGDTM